MAFLTILKLDHCTLGRRIIYQEISSTALCKISPFISFHYQKFNLQDLAHLVEIGKIPKVKSAVELFQLWHSIKKTCSSPFSFWHEQGQCACGEKDAEMHFLWYFINWWCIWFVLHFQSYWWKIKIRKIKHSSLSFFEKSKPYM